MTEISKMFENANIKKIHKYQREIDNGDPRFTGISHSDSYIVYPDFTTEKQLELIKWLGEWDYSVRIDFRENEWGVATEYNSGNFQDSLPDALASIINDIWQSLTDQEKEEIRRILE